jgi:hypothetical protein
MDSLMPPLAAVAVTGLVVSFGLPLLIVALVLFYRHRRQRMIHDTIARLAEKGLPVPPELLEPPGKAQAGLRAGLVLVALGLALAIVFWERGPGWTIGLIPGLMGAALLLAWKIENRPPGG